MDNSNNKPAFKEPQRMGMLYFGANVLAAILIPPMGIVLISVAIPCAVLGVPFLAAGYVQESYFTVKYVIEKKIEKYKIFYEDSLKDSQKADNIFDSEKHSAKAEYFNAIRDAYISLMNRKTSVELESCYHHKSIMKDDVYITEKKSAQDKFINSLLSAEKNMLLSCVIKETYVTNPLI